MQLKRRILHMRMIITKRFPELEVSPDSTAAIYMAMETTFSNMHRNWFLHWNHVVVSRLFGYAQTAAGDALYYGTANLFVALVPR